MSTKNQIKPAAPSIAEAPPALGSLVLTVGEVAALLKVPPSSVYEMTRFRGTRTGKPTLPYRKVGRYIRVVRSELDAWLVSLPREAKTKKRNYRERKAAA